MGTPKRPVRPDTRLSGCAPACRVLLVESDDDTRDLYDEYLRYCGFNVAAVATTDEAVRHAPSADAVVTGVGVRGTIDGIELVRALRQLPKTARTPMLVVTAHAFDSVRARALDAGANLFLPKPCLPHDLVGGIQRVMRCNCRRSASVNAASGSQGAAAAQAN